MQRHFFRTHATKDFQSKGSDASKMAEVRGTSVRSREDDKARHGDPERHMESKESKDRKEEPTRKSFANLEKTKWKDDRFFKRQMFSFCRRQAGTSIRRRLAGKFFKANYKSDGRRLAGKFFERKN